MLPHLRAVEKGIKAIDEYLGKVSKGALLDENGHCRLQSENVGIHVVVAPARDLVIFKTFTNFVPDPTSGKILPLYYHLLDVSDNPETGLAFFAIVASEEMGAEHDMISVECKRPITDISYDEFVACLKAVSEVANHYMVKLEEEFAAPRVP